MFRFLNVFEKRKEKILPLRSPDDAFLHSLSICYFRALSSYETNQSPNAPDGTLQCTNQLKSSPRPKQKNPFLILNLWFKIGLGSSIVPHSNRPHRPHRLHQHRHHLSRWLSVRVWRKRRYDHALGSQRVQAPLFAARRRRDACARLLAQPLLAVRRHGQLHYHLRSRETE